MNCPLCQGQSVQEWSTDRHRPYFICEDCTLIFVPRNFLIGPEKEKQRYDTHQNHAEDPRYVEYLTKIARGIAARLEKGEVGLDFGCGASTLLADILGKYGFQVESHDQFYYPSEEFWNKKFDFIILSEVIEHLADPRETMERLRALLKPYAKFYIKTKYYPRKKEAFKSWFYKNDLTHVQFFSEDAMAFLAQSLKLKGPLELACEDLVELRQH